MESYPLGFKDVHVQVTRFQGNVMIHIRVVDPDTGRFTQRGIALVETEWRHLVSLFPRIESYLDSGHGDRLALGARDRYLSVASFRGRAYVDLRTFWRRDGELYPTRRGAVLNREAWDALVQIRYLVEEDIERMRATIEDGQQEYNESQRADLFLRAGMARKRQTMQDASAAPAAKKKSITPTRIWQKPRVGEGQQVRRRLLFRADSNEQSTSQQQLPEQLQPHPHQLFSQHDGQRQQQSSQQFSQGPPQQQHQSQQVPQDPPQREPPQEQPKKDLKPQSPGAVAEHVGHRPRLLTRLRVVDNTPSTAEVITASSVMPATPVRPGPLSRTGPRSDSTARRSLAAQYGQSPDKCALYCDDEDSQIIISDTESP